jgi:hypothetical protein
MSKSPLIYFLGIAPGRYQAMVPAFISGWDAKALKARVAFGVPDPRGPWHHIKRPLAPHEVRQEMAQAKCDQLFAATARPCWGFSKYVNCTAPTQRGRKGPSEGWFSLWNFCSIESTNELR